MRRWWLAVLPLFWSCADNLPDAPAESARLETVEIPDLIVAGWPEALEFRVQALVPDEGEWTVALRVSGPGLDGAVDYLLLDDGDFLELDHPGPGQATHSGDNVPGDGWFSTRISADFSAELGSFTLRAMLLKDGVEQDFRQTSRMRQENRAPAILSLETPTSLPSGGTFITSLRAADPDGPEDLASATLTQSGGVQRSWPFVRQGDSLFTLSIGPELAAGRQGPDTLSIEVADRVGNTHLLTREVVLENAAPSLTPGELELWRWNEGSGQWDGVAADDTLRLPLPATGSVYFQLSVPVQDPQTAADLELVEWSIARTTVAFDQLVWYPLNDDGPGEDGVDWVAGDGRWSGAFELPWDAPVVERYLRLRARDRVGQGTEVARWLLLVVPPQGSGRPDGGFQRLAAPRPRSGGVRIQ